MAMKFFPVQSVNKAKEQQRVRTINRFSSQRKLLHVSVIGTGVNTFFGRAAKLVGSANDEIGHLQTILAKIGNFCIVAIGIFIIAEIFVM